MTSPGSDDVGPADVASAMMARDRASQLLRMELGSVADGRAEVTMTVGDDMVNGHGMCHGGLIFSLADTAFAMACNTGNEVTVAAGASVEFVEPAPAGSQLVATAARTVERGRTAVYDVEVRTAEGTLVAVFRGRSHRVGGPVV